MYKLPVWYTFMWSFILGAILAFVIFHSTEKSHVIRESQRRRESLQDKYENWFKRNGLKRTNLLMDQVRYGSIDDKTIEANILFGKVRLLCVLLVRKRKNAIAANNTWARHCNERLFVYLKPERTQKTMLPIRREKIESSWHLLCEAIRVKVNLRYDWSLFVYDDTFAIPENVRKMVAALDPNQAYYLGHAISFWGTVFNVGQAGYVLSRSSIVAIKNQFNTTEKCIAGGRFWKREDFYLGKHLSTMGIVPIDTRDSYDLSTFHKYNLGQMLSPGSLPKFSNYYKYSIYPVKCCSPDSVTFQSIEADKMYTNYYMLYSVQLFTNGNIGNRPGPTPVPEDEVWKSFVREQKIDDVNISAKRYFELWKNVLTDPVNFNQNIKKWNDRTASLH